MFLLLIGPKGSGKSHIGRLLESHLGVHFLHVEPIWMAYHTECAREGREVSIAEGIERVRPAIIKALETYDHVCIETTGGSRAILDDLVALGRRYGLRTIGVTAPLEICLDRIRQRDPTHQIPMDEEGIRKVWEIADRLDLEYDLVIENVDLSDADVVARVQSALS